MISAKTRKTDSNSSTVFGDSDPLGSFWAVFQGEPFDFVFSLNIQFPLAPQHLVSVPENRPFSKHQIAIFRVC